MKTEDKNKEANINEKAISLEVDSEVIGKVRTGEITHIVTPINENSQNLISHNIDGKRAKELIKGINIVRSSSGKTRKVLVK